MALHPNARVEVDGRELSSAEGAVWSVRVSLSLGAAHDRATIRCWPRSAFAGASPGVTMTVRLGEVGDETLVWTGTLGRVEREPDALVLEGLSDTASLSALRTSRSYVDQSVADIVGDLASDTTVDEVEADVSLSAYHLDDRRSAWSHIQELAALAGAEVGSSPGGGLRFVSPRSGSADHTLRFGAEVLRWQAGPASAPTPVVAAAHGSGSESGADQWHWIRRDLGGGDAPLRAVAAFATRDAADNLTSVLEARAAAAGTGGRLILTGDPEIRPGDLLEVTDLPDGDPGVLRARAVEHFLDGRTGFVTVVAAEGAGA